jgi:hypothetical protein
MKLSHYLLGSATGLAMGLVGMTTAGFAAPLNAGPMSATPLSIEKVAARCWWRNGRRHCSYGYRSYRRSQYREYGFPENYRSGSTRWWQEMDRQERGGRR